MGKKKIRNSGDAPEVDMTPMIDCVFQLIIFFMLIMSIKSVYGIAIKFPRGSDTPPAKKERQIKPVVIWVGPDRYTEGHKILEEGYVKLNNEPIGLGTDPDPAKAEIQHKAGMDYIRKQLIYLLSGKEGKYDTVMTVTGEVNSYHGKIVEVVDQGKRAGLKGFSMLPPQVR